MRSSLANSRPARYVSTLHAWYIDPIAQMLEVLARQDKKWLIAATLKEADAVSAPPFEAHTFALDALWSIG